MPALVELDREERADAARAGAPARPADEHDALRVDRLADRQDHRALDQVSQLAHVARVVVGAQDALGLRATARGAACSCARRSMRQEVRASGRMSSRRSRSGGSAEVEHVEAVVEVEAEGAALDLAGEVLVGRGDDAHVDRQVARAAEAPEGHLLEHLEQLGLRPGAQLADLVEEQRAAVGRLEQAALLRLGVGEGAALVAEQLALEQVLGQRRAVDLDERLVAARPACGGGSGRRPAPCRCPTRPG